MNGSRHAKAVKIVTSLTAWELVSSWVVICIEAGIESIASVFPDRGVVGGLVVGITSGSG